MPAPLASKLGFAITTSLVPRLMIATASKTAEASPPAAACELMTRNADVEVAVHAKFASE